MTSSFQTLWSSGNPAGLLRLARDIEAHESWRGFLTIQEHDIFKSALDKGGRIWHEFINGNATCSMEQPSPASTPAPPATAINFNAMPAPTKVEKPPFTNGHATVTPSSPAPLTPTDLLLVPEEKQSTTENLQLDAVTVAFRVRYMLYEKSIGMIFPSMDPSISPDIDYAIFEEPEEESAPPPRPAVRAVDDDYDDEDDDEDETKLDLAPAAVIDDPSEKPVILSMFIFYITLSF